MINREIDLMFLSGVIYQDKFFSREDYEATKDDCYEYAWRAKEELDDFTYRQVIRIFSDFEGLIRHESMPFETFEEYFFTTDHIRKD
jgi:hypothetical protein